MTAFVTNKNKKQPSTVKNNTSKMQSTLSLFKKSSEKDKNEESSGK